MWKNIEKQLITRKLRCTFFSFPLLILLLYFHTARHTCATLLVHQGVPITTVQRLLGHTSVKTTQIYSEVMDETMIKDLMRANKKYNRGQLEIVKQNHEDSSSMDKKI